MIVKRIVSGKKGKSTFGVVAAGPEPAGHGVRVTHAREGAGHVSCCKLHPQQEWGILKDILGTEKSVDTV